MHAYQTYYWQNVSKQRYYIARLEKDLLDDWIVVRIFGGVQSHKILSTYCASRASRYLQTLTIRVFVHRTAINGLKALLYRHFLYKLKKWFTILVKFIKNLFNLYKEFLLWRPPDLLQKNRHSPLNKKSRHWIKISLP